MAKEKARHAMEREAAPVAQRDAARKEGYAAEEAAAAMDAVAVAIEATAAAEKSAAAAGLEREKAAVTATPFTLFLSALSALFLSHLSIKRTHLMLPKDLRPDARLGKPPDGPRRGGRQNTPCASPSVTPLPDGASSEWWCSRASHRQLLGFVRHLPHRLGASCRSPPGFPCRCHP